MRASGADLGGKRTETESGLICPYATWRCFLLCLGGGHPERQFIAVDHDDELSNLAGGAFVVTAGGPSVTNSMLCYERFVTCESATSLPLGK